MKISLNWLKEYIPGLRIDSSEELYNKMVSSGLDIESEVHEGKKFDKFVVGEVIEKQPHPNADKLSLCKVNTGDRVLNIVCGAPNVAQGQKVCVALTGAVIPNGGFEIKKSKIRGELSEGMICSERELNMSDDHEGILVLDKDAKPGESFAGYTKADDILYEIGITPNRGDLNSHIGVAREVAALYDKNISLPETKIEESQVPTSDLIKITIDNPALCRRFTGRVIQNVTIKESPEWLKKRLLSVGLRPRNNIVDITNFVMFETGQPLHAFDYDKIRGKEIIVKTASDGDKFVTLDSKERILNSDSLMICDAEGYSGIAGIMGGEFSEITNDTKNIFLEVAYFDPVSVRRNSRKLGLQTDASYRFERGVDMNMVDYSSLRATSLIRELAGGEVSKGLYDVYPEPFEKIQIGLRTEKANSLIGKTFTGEEIIKLLDRIEIKFLSDENGKLEFAIPEFRRLDLEREADLIEEVARIYGYDNLEGDTSFKIYVSRGNEADSNNSFMKEITDHLVGRGFNQIMTNPLVDGNKIRFNSDKTVKLKNSNSAEMNSLRTSLANGVLRVIGNNFDNSGKDISLRLFEIGKTFSDEGKEFEEETMLIIALAGKRDTELIYGGEKDFDLFDMKGEAEMFLSKLNLENYRLFYNIGNANENSKIDILVHDDIIGSIYCADSSLKSEFGIESEVYIAEINADKLVKKQGKVKHYRQISKYPSVKRDLAIVVDRKIGYDQLSDSITKSAGRSLKSVNLFDIYEGEKVGKDKRSLALTLEFLSPEKTLTDEEVNKVISKIVKNLETNLGATLRS